MPKTILCLSDSNTYGYDPRGAFGGRYPEGTRWTSRLAQSGAWVIHNLGENGREIPHTPYLLDLLMRQLDALRRWTASAVLFFRCNFPQVQARDRCVRRIPRTVLLKLRTGQLLQTVQAA